MSKFFTAFIALALFAAPALAADKAPAQKPASEVIDSGWNMRCNTKKPEKNACEVFKKLSQGENGPRIAEFAIGFPKDQDAASGVIILPLGILLEKGISMQVDSGKPYVFQIRYCTNAGCFSYVSLKPALLDEIKKGKKLNFAFKTSEGQKVNLIMALDGLDKVIKALP